MTGVSAPGTPFSFVFLLIFYLCASCVVDFFSAEELRRGAEISAELEQHWQAGRDKRACRNAGIVQQKSSRWLRSCMEQHAVAEVEAIRAGRAAVAAGYSPRLGPSKPKRSPPASRPEQPAATPFKTTELRREISFDTLGNPLHSGNDIRSPPKKNALNR